MTPPALIAEIRALRIAWRKSDDAYRTKPTAMCQAWRHDNGDLIPCPSVAHPDYPMCDGCRKSAPSNKQEKAMTRPIPDHVRDAAVADYRTSGDSYKEVAKRHGISRSRLHALVNPEGVKKRKPKRWGAEEIEYVGGWVNRGGVMYPLLPEQRSA